MKVKSSYFQLIIEAIVVVIISITISLIPEKSEAQTTKTMSVILDPLIEKYCKDLTMKKDRKIEYKNGLLKLIKKNKKLQSITPPAKKTIQLKLQKNLRAAETSFHRAVKKIKALEMDLARKGCPGKL